MVNKMLNYLKEKWKSIKNIKEILKENKFMIKPFLCIAVILAISISSIIRADYNYVDDLRRVAEGYIGWANYSRFISEFLSIFIHCDTYLTDVSPLPQLIAVCKMAMSSIIIIYVYKNDKKISIWDIIAVVPLGLSPYFLECLSYKYDAPYMAISIFVSVFPLLFRKKKSIIYSIVIILCTLVMCMTYQASSGIFLMFVLLIALKHWNEGKSLKEIFKFLIISFVNYFIALLIFKLFIMKPAYNYVSNYMISFDELIPGAIQHLYKYFSLVIVDLKKEWLILIGIIAIFFIYTFICNTKQKKYIVFPISIIILFFMAILSFGMYPVLEMPLFAPRAMYGVGAFIALMAVVISSSPKIYLGKIVVCILSWTFIVFGFTYGNALKVQDEYTDFRVNLVIQDLNELEIFSNDETKIVQIHGSIGKAPVLKNMKQDYQILNKLVSVQFAGNSYWGKYYFYNYFDLRNIKANKSENLLAYNLPVLKDTMYHTIKGNDKYILIELK